MKIDTSNTRQINVSVMEGQEQKALFYASYRPGKNLNINLEILDGTYATAHMDEIADAFNDFLASAMTQANAAELPVHPTLAETQA